MNQDNWHFALAWIAVGIVASQLLIWIDSLMRCIV